MKEKYYIATSIPYVNAKPHMGHCLDALYGDVLARHYREQGREVILQVGVDENGQKLYQKACEQGKSPEEWIAELHPVFVDFFKKLEISYDVFTRTSDQKTHWPAAQELWRRAEKNGDIYKKKYAGLYCVGCESFKTEADLVDGKCPDHQTVPEKVEEENYFFALSKYEDYLKNLFEKNPDFVYPKNSYNEAYEMLKRGLEDVSISRPKSRLPWGVPVPGDEDHVMYVWFDALTNYLTALGFPKDEDKMNRFWPPDVEIIGKDNNRWHTLLWPAMLKSGGLEPPKKVLVHYHVVGKGGVKMSKTIGNVIDPVEMIESYGAESFRYFILTQIPIDTDGSFDEERFKKVYAADLSNDLGNLLQRTISMINKYETEVGLPDILSVDVDGPTGTSIREDVEARVEALDFKGALEEVWKVIRDLNGEIDRSKPWELAKSDPKKLSEALSFIYENLYGIGELLSVFMPETSENILKQLKSLEPSPLFPRLED
jgi:methionyl-tRNA synthetase